MSLLVAHFYQEFEIETPKNLSIWSKVQDFMNLKFDIRVFESRFRLKEALKGGLISEGIFTLVQSSEVCKITILNFFTFI